MSSARVGILLASTYSRNTGLAHFPICEYSPLVLVPKLIHYNSGQNFKTGLPVVSVIYSGVSVYRRSCLVNHMLSRVKL